MRRGTSVLEFFERFPDEASCLRHLFAVRWGNHSPCPRCRQPGGHWFAVTGTKKYRHSCRTQISVLENTIFYRSNLSLMAWFYAMLLFGNASVGVRGSFLRRHLGLGLRSAYRMANLIRLQMAGYERPAALGGPGQKVYVDETLLRYSRANVRSRRADRLIVMGFASQGKVIAGIIPDRGRATITAMIERYVRPGSIIVSDGHSSYKRVPKLGWDHIVVNHSVAFCDFEGNTLNNIEAYWRVLKRSLAGHRMILTDNVWRYLAEVEFRFNHRESNQSNFLHLIAYTAEVGGERTAELRRRYDWR